MYFPAFWTFIKSIHSYFTLEFYSVGHRAAGVVVLHAVAEVVQQVAVVGLGDDLDFHGPARAEQDRADARGQFEDVGGALEELVDVF